MGSKRLGSKTMLLSLLVLVLFPVLNSFAQENYAPNQNPQFVQRLSWYGDENAIRYEVTIEEVPEGGSVVSSAVNYREVLRRSTVEDHLEFSLPAGKYRYRIRAWDIFEKPTPYSPWYSLEIRQAIRPEIFELRAEAADAVDGTAATEKTRLFLRGKNLSAGTVAELRNNNGRLLNTGGFQIRPPADPAQSPAGTEEDEGIITLPGPLTPGDYELTLRNPGGLFTAARFTVAGEPEIKKPKPAAEKAVTAPQPRPGFFVSAAYTPLMPLYGEFNELLATPIYPAGALLRLEFLPLRFGSPTAPLGFSLGLGLSPAWHMLSTSYRINDKDYELSGHFLGGQGYILGQIQLPKGMAINIRAGGGVFLLQNLNKHNEDESYETINVLFPAGSGGLSFLWAFHRPFFVELGMDLTHLFSVDDSSPGFLRPFVGLGLCF